MRQNFLAAAIFPRKCRRCINIERQNFLGKIAAATEFPVTPSLFIAASLCPLAFGSGGELIWRSHTLSCGYIRQTRGEPVSLAGQSEDKLQVSGVALGAQVVSFPDPIPLRCIKVW